MDKFTETYLKIIAEANEMNQTGSLDNEVETPVDAVDNQKYSMTLLYTVVDEGEELQFDEIKKEADEFFAQYGGIRTTDEDYDVAYYLHLPSNDGVYAWPYEFTGLTKDQIFELMNSETPYNEGLSLIEISEQYFEAPDPEMVPNENPDEMIEYLKVAKGESIVLTFK